MNLWGVNHVNHCAFEWRQNENTYYERTGTEEWCHKSNAFVEKHVSFVQSWRGEDTEDRLKAICHDVLGRGPDFLSVLVPLQLNCRVGQVDHQADLSTFVHLIRWFEFLCKGFEKSSQEKSLKGQVYLHTTKADVATHPKVAKNADLPSLFFSSFGIFFILFSRPLRSVMPYIKAIFSYWSGRAFFRISQTSTSGASSCCFTSLTVPDTSDICEGRSHRLVFATCPKELLIDLQNRKLSEALVEPGEHP